MLPASTSTPFLSAVAAFLRAENFPRQRLATFHGRDLLVVRSPSSSIALHLLPTPCSSAEVLPASTSSALSDAYAARARPPGRRRAALVHLWEDQWLEHHGIVTSRLLSMLGRTTRLMARQTRAVRIDAATIDAFLLEVRAPPPCSLSVLSPALTLRVCALRAEPPMGRHQGSLPLRAVQ